jgi:hypothetical protein
MLLTSLTIPVEEFETATGWVAKPEGMCKGDMCVPTSAAITDDGLIDIESVAPKLGMALEAEDQTGVWALGPESGGRALTTAAVPALELPDANGNPFKLSSLLGRKVLLVAWASW